jgi:hypothetical protein
VAVFPRRWRAPVDSGGHPRVLQFWEGEEEVKDKITWPEKLRRHHSPERGSGGLGSSVAVLLRQSSSVAERSCSTRGRRGVRERPPSRGRTSTDEAHRGGGRTAAAALRRRCSNRMQGGSGGGSHAVRLRGEKGGSDTAIVALFKRHGGTVWKGVPAPVKCGRRSH